MAAAASVGDLLRRRLREIGRTPQQLAEAVSLPPEYIHEIIAGSRRPPRPGRTDIYPKMTSFLRLKRNDVVACALAERSADASPEATCPDARVRRQFLELCEPETARALERRRGRRGNVELAGFLQRVLDVAQGAVQQTLDDTIGLRLQAAERGCTYEAMRVRILDFLDLTADTLTAQDLADFVWPRIALWDVDVDTGVLRVVLRPYPPRQRPARRTPAQRSHDY